MNWIDVLPHTNAMMNATAGVALLTGWFMIRAGRKKAHRNAMLTACGASTLFLVGYLTRYFLEGTHHFPGGGLVKVFYLSVLFTHMILAMVVVPLVLTTLYLAFTEQFTRHRSWARWTLPIWFYVSVTGIFVYVMLYWIYPPV